MAEERTDIQKEASFFFMHHNDRSRITIWTVEYFAKIRLKNDRLKERLSYSPDINPIKYPWVIIKRRHYDGSKQCLSNINGL